MISIKAEALRENFTRSREMQQRMHALVPGGCHTCAKGDDQYPVLAPGFIGTTPVDAGVPQAIKDQTVSFRYNDLDSVRALFSEYRGQIARLILEPAKYEDPVNRFLHETQRICHDEGAIFILDEMITGFRWANGGGQQVYDIVPDLSTFGKGMGNGFALSALAGRRELMKLGGLFHEKQRVFLLSTTHGAETHAMAAGLATMRTYQQEPVIETLRRQGERLRQGLGEVARRHGVERQVEILGRPSNMVFTSRDQENRPSQAFRSLLLQELIKRGVLGPSLVISYSHTDEDIDCTLDAFDGALAVYRAALKDGVEKYLVGRPSSIVYRRYD